MCALRSNVLAAKQRFADGLVECQCLHEAGRSGVEVSAALSDLRDEVLLNLVDVAMNELGEAGENGLWSHITLVAHGGYGRRDVAPYSDVDLMLLYEPKSADRVARLAERLLRDVFDAGLTLGHSVRTPEQACRLACADPVICTSLAESRLLRGSEPLFLEFSHRFQRQAHRHMHGLMAKIQEDRNEEQRRYGETVYLLEPNIKRTRGTLRDIQLLRWIGFVRYGSNQPNELQARGWLSDDDCRELAEAGEFLLRLRNELHFHAKQAADVLDRAEQLRIAEQRGYVDRPGLLAVEQFMRDYFRHTAAVSHISSRFVAKAESRERLTRLTTVLFGHRVEDGVHVGPAGILASRRALQSIEGDLTAIMRLVDLSNLYDKPIAPSTWESIRQAVPQLPKAMPTLEACRHFLSLLSHPARLGQLLRGLHDAHLLERFIPEFRHARGLLQFNQYHKYTVDEHCLRAVEFATQLWFDRGPLGRVYRPLAQKHLLHLALLLHDLGKGYLEDHREIGTRIAGNAGRRLGLPPHEIESLKFLVHKHMTMNHLALRRDTGDEQLAVQFAVQVGSPELLQMLYLLTAADLGAVGPGVWDGWKTEVVTELYHRTMQHLAGESPETTIDALAGHQRGAVYDQLGRRRNDKWFKEHVQSLPTAYLNATPPEQVAADLQLLRDLRPNGISVESRYQPETANVQFTIATSEQTARGIFHRLTGALSSHGLQIRGAQIHTLPDGLILDRFHTHDPDYAGEPPRQRLDEVERSLVAALTSDTAPPPAFRRTWSVGQHRTVRVPGVPTRVNVDNSTSNRFTIIDIFTHDRAGLLYAISRVLFELDLSVARAKIGTYLDQVVDVFYVTDQQDRKIKDDVRVAEIRRRLLEVVERDGIAVLKIRPHCGDVGRNIPTDCRSIPV